MQFDTSLDLSDELHGIIDSKGVIAWVNQAVVNILYYVDREAIIDKSFYDLLPSNQRLPMQEKLVTLIVNKASAFETELLNVAGEKIHVRGKIIKKENGFYHLLGSLVLAQEAKLSKFKRFFDVSLLEIILSVDTKGKVSYFNRGLSETLGFSSEEVIQIDFMTLILEESRDLMSQNMKQLKENEGITLNFTSKCAHKTERYRIIQWKMTFNKDAYYAVGNDITVQEEQRLKNELLVEDLSKLYKETALTLLELETKNKELDLFVYKASHDLRAPITSIMGLIYLVRLDGSSIESLTFLIDKIESSIYRLNTFISQLQQHNLSDKDIDNDSLVVIDFQKFLENSLENIRYKEAFGYITFDIQVTTGNQCVDFVFNDMKLNIIINNIISNSIKYRNKKVKKCLINITVDASNAKYAVIKIWDNGIGIEEKVISKIFDMFYRGVELSDGSGLGLYTTQKTLQKLNCSINVVSEIDVFTEVTIVLKNMNVEIMQKST